MHHAGIFLEYFSEAKALSIVRVFYWNFPGKEFLFGEDGYKNNNNKKKKIEENSKFEQISNVTGAAVMQLSRDWGEV